VNPSVEPARLSSEARRNSLESFNWSAVFRTFYDTTCGAGTFVFVGFVLSLGVAKEDMGFLAGVVSFACLAQVASLALANYVTDKKAFIIAVAAVEPILFVGAVMALPHLPASARIPVLVAAVFLAAAFSHLTRPLTDNWLATTVPEGLRGRYLGRRFQLMAAVSVVATLGAGFLNERIDKSNTVGLGCMIAAGGIFGVLAVFALRNAAMPTLSAESRVTMKDLRDILREKVFRRYVLFSLIYNLPFFFACPYYQVFNLQELKMKESVIALMMVGYQVVRIITTRFAGPLLDRKGVCWTALACGGVYTAFFLTFPFCSPERYWPLLIAWAAAGAADAAFSITVTAALYGSVPNTASRPAYFAISNLIGVGAYGLGALIAVPVLTALKGVSFDFAGLRVGQFHCYYFLIAITMIACTFGALLMEKRK
jgi:MFS family permease